MQGKNAPRGVEVELRNHLPAPENTHRREIHEGLNVIENWNRANGFIWFDSARVGRVGSADE